MPSTVATTSTLAMLRLAESRGYATQDLLAAAGVARELVEDPDERLRGPTVLALWEALRERSGDPSLQLLAPTTLPFGAYRVIEYLVGASASVGEGIRRFARFFGLIADGTRLSVEGENDEPRLHLARADGGVLPGIYADYIFAALVGRIRLHVRPELRLRRVEMRHPPPIDPAPYVDCFQAPVRFGAAADQLWFDLAEWNAPLARSDAGLARLLEDHASLLSARLDATRPDFAAAVREALVAALPENGGAAAVARALHVSVRTLQRRLVAAGTTFRDVSDAALRGLAEAYLVDPGTSLAEVAYLLGFSDQTSFNRAFRSWTGASPGTWRKGSAASELAAGRARLTGAGRGRA